jgi:lycopene cyclase domain-containing protein
LKSKYLYLTINFLSFLLPFLFSFYPKASFFRKWKYVWPAIIISGVIFVFWDATFTWLGVWGFNPEYVTGIFWLGLPIEEILFFICIPYACLFTYFALNHLIEKDYLRRHHELITSALTILLMILGLYNIDRMYTAAALLSTGFFLAFGLLKLRMRFMGRFYLAFGLLLIPFLLINGALTGAFTEEPIVWYNNAENLGIRLGTIPVEDVIYGMLMILLPITIWEKLEHGY